MSSCRTETLDVTGAYCKKLRSELAAHSNLGSLSAAAPRSPGYRDPAKPLSSYDRDLDANDEVSPDFKLGQSGNPKGKPRGPITQPDSWRA